MRRGLLLGGALCALLMASVPVQANISVFLDNPSAGPLSGNDLVSGWAFALVDESPVDVTVTVRIDGENQNEVLCCSPRADVQADNPGAPLNTGFASLIPYGELSAGPHTIGVQITAEGCDPVIIDRSVVVVKPGGASFIQSMDFSGASFAATGEGFDADGVGVTSANGTVNDDLDVAFSSSSQALLITGPAADNAILFVANLNGEQEVADVALASTAKVVDTPASGTATFTLNADNTLDYEVTVTDIPGTLVSLPPDATPTSAAHIHNAPAGVNGGIMIFLEPAVPTGPPFVWSGTTAALDPALMDALQAGELYVNVHTVENPAGEVRGQIVASDQNCQDPLRTVFAGFAPQPDVIAPGSAPNAGIACRSFTDQASCEMAWQVNPAGVTAPCLWSSDLMVCGACGPVLEGQDFCTNTC